MKDKKSAFLSGILMHPLLVGARALILNGGKVIRTSPVVAIHDSSAEMIRFETMNTNYTLVMGPAPQAAAGAVLTNLAA